MKTVIRAAIEDLDNIVNIDSEVIGNTSRRDYIQNAIERGHCIIAKNQQEIEGFLIYDTTFFDCSFISLIIVSPSKRRKGNASSLIDFMLRTAPTAKIFSSTNRSNVNMQKVFSANGFIQSGIVENLDEGDPEIIYFKSKLINY
ncbi:GNAT family N-acetyltransferase [Bacillus sp. CMF12]|uniref:GNAT family N-acetyltransferase n=1 Tax=Bacillaceae TaxID=186817 RepID=UPI001FB47733|nr:MULTISPECIES: GNAT family N-acetyltransferase [Bacillaceae]UOE56053.1 GNAT family N-acetyltransferase [Cytobacillus oceanisediminis]USK50521.1 GNAT family N-acetyltransferase [Bacillus sp. CMF12]